MLVRRSSSVAAGLAALLSMAALANGCTSAGRSHAGELACPRAPYVPRATSGDLEQSALRGPALADTSGGRFVHALRLDDGGLVVEPPRGGDRPGFAGDTALCEVMASSRSNGMTVGRQSRDTIAAGLARVTVRDSLLHDSRLNGVTESGSIDGIPDVNVRVPAPRAYHDRLAWVFVVDNAERSSCPAASGSAPPVHVDHNRYGYSVFVVDATSGSDALVYTERMGSACAVASFAGPFVDVPTMTVSLPWRLVSVQRDRSRGVVTFDVGACDGYQGVTTTSNDPPKDVVRVVVNRPFGPVCRPVRTVTEKLRALDLGDLLPDPVRHAPLGVYITS